MHATAEVPSLVERHRIDEVCPGRPPLRLPIGMPVLEARAALAGTGEGMALVTNRGADVGVVIAEDLRLDESEQTSSIGDVMRREIVRIEPTTDLRRTLRTYREFAWSSAIRRRPGQRQTRSTP